MTATPRWLPIARGSMLGMVLIALLSGCEKESDPPAYAHPQAAELEAALLEMLAQPVDPFLILENQTTGDFIQFYNDDGRILIDLPQVALSAEKRSAAKAYFRKHGVQLRTSKDKDPESGVAVVSETWSRTYPEDQVKQVASLALGALHEIHGISGATRLTLTRGWQ